MKKYKAVFLDYLPLDLNNIYASHATEDIEFVGMETKDTPEMLEKSKNADFYMLFGMPYGITVDKQLIDHSPNLKMLVSHGMSFEKIDLAYANSKKIPIVGTPVATDEDVAEFTIMMILASMRRLPFADSALRKGNFYTWELRGFSYSLMGKTVGLIGFGSIAHFVAERLRGFGVKIVIYDKYKKFAEKEQEILGVQQVNSLGELAACSDVVSLHANYSAADHGSINRETLFDKMKPTAFFINTARGKLVNQKDIAQVLKEKRIAGAALDVYEEETVHLDDPLVGLENVVLTPHIGSGTRDVIAARAEYMFDNMRRFLKNRPLRNCINSDQIKTQGKGE
jgi:lactate dehydrogenase-like 2-hydroxyacid dehydrogenase